jgi:hypothetical protein
MLQSRFQSSSQSWFTGLILPIVILLSLLVAFPEAAQAKPVSSFLVRELIKTFMIKPPSPKPPVRTPGGRPISSGEIFSRGTYQWQPPISPKPVEKSSPIQTVHLQF